MANLYSVRFFDFINNDVETIFMRAHDFECAFSGVNDYLLNRFQHFIESCDEDEGLPFEILSISREEIFIDQVQLEDEQNGKVGDEQFEKVTCAQCGFENTFPSGMASIKCSKCGKVIEKKQENKQKEKDSD